MPPRNLLVTGAVIVALLALLPLAGSRYAVDLATEVLIYCLFALSLNVLLGFTGNISFGHAAYFAIGGYTCAILLTTYGWPLVLAMPAAVIMAGLVAAVVGFFCVRLTWIYFAMLTLAFAMLVWGVAFKWKAVTGGDDGFTGIRVPEFIAHHTHFFYFTLAVVSAGVVALWVICHSAFGLTLVAIRENGVRAGFIGVDTRKMRWAAFTVAGTFGGLAGALFGMYHRGMYIENAFWTESAQVLIMVLLGGIHSFVGPIIGATVLYLLQVFTNQYTPYWPTVLGLILLVIVMVLPEGLVGLAKRLARFRAASNGTRAAQPRSAAEPALGSRGAPP
jgi:branched-chain amino acid transport system permease protein